MKLYLLALLMVLPACAAQAEELTPAAFKDVTTVEGFYLRQVEMVNKTAIGAPAAVRECVGSSLAKIASESSNRLIEAFLADRTQGSLDAYVWADQVSMTPERQAAAKAALETCASLAN